MRSFRERGVQVKFTGDNCEKDQKTFISRIFEKLKKSNKEFQKKFLAYFEQFGGPDLKKEEDFESKERFYEYQKNLYGYTLNGTRVKSLAERKIMNFFFTHTCLLYTSPSPRDRTRSRMPSSA